MPRTYKWWIFVMKKWAHSTDIGLHYYFIGISEFLSFSCGDYHNGLLPMEPSVGDTWLHVVPSPGRHKTKFGENLNVRQVFNSPIVVLTDISVEFFLDVNCNLWLGCNNRVLTIGRDWITLCHRYWQVQSFPSWRRLTGIQPYSRTNSLFEKVDCTYLGTEIYHSRYRESIGWLGVCLHCR